MRIVGNDPELSRQLMATASGAISAAGKPLVVNTDGTVSVISNSPDVLSDQSSAIYSGDFQMAAAVYDEGQDKVLFVYSGASNYGYAVVGTVSGNSISFGTPTAFISSAAGYVAATYDPDNAKTAIFWSDTGDSNKQKAVVATISGTSVSFGTVAIFSDVASGVPTKDSTYDTSENKFIVVFSKGTFPSARTMEALAATISGTDISFGSETEIGSSTTAEIGVAYDANADKSLVIYRDPSTNYVKSRVLSLSGTTVSAGTETTLYGAAGDKLGITYDSTAQKLVAFYRHDSGTTHTKFIVATISGTSVSYGTPVDTGIDFNGTPRNNSIHHNVAANKIVFIGRDGGNSFIIKYVIATVSGTSITIDNTVTIYDDSNDSYLSCNVYDPDQEKSILFYADGTAGAFKNPVVRVLTVGAGENLTTENYIGTSAYPAADGAKVLVNTQGAVDDNQSGLTAGQTYYVDVNGDLVLTTNATASVGTESVFETGSSSVTKVAFDSNSNRILAVYSDEGDSDKGKAVVGTVASDGTISYGTPVVFNDAATKEYFGINVVFDSNVNKFAIFYADGGGSGGAGRARVATVDPSDNSVTFGTEATFESGDVAYISATFDSSANKIIIAYMDDSNSDNGTAIVGTISGTDITFGSASVFEGASTFHVSATYDSTNNKTLISFRDVGDSSKGKSRVATVSGTSLSFGTVQTFSSVGITNYINSVFDPDSGKVIITYEENAVTDSKGRAKVATISGTDVSFGSVATTNDASTYTSAPTYDTLNNKVIVIFRDNSNDNYTTAVEGTVSGTSISFGSETVIYSGYGAYADATFDSNVNKGVVVYSGQADSGRGASATFTAAQDLSGSLSHNVVTAGTALSATKLLVKG
tara:strand:+ start:1710 stop:4325 length:2616 start_codon:yes stop_codon:yes gene_type:complete